MTTLRRGTPAPALDVAQIGVEAASEWVYQIDLAPGRGSKFLAGTPSLHPSFCCPPHSPTTQSLNAFTSGVCARASGYTR